MPSHRRLFAIIFRESRRQPGCDRINGVDPDGTDVLVLDVLAILVNQFEPGSEFEFF